LITRLATLAMRSGLPTEVPPYFCTINAIALTSPYLTTISNQTICDL
jgi:hypothetical protein